MLDFLRILEVEGRRGVIDILPDFDVGKSTDLMIRGQSFYAIYLGDETHLWSDDEYEAIHIIDRELDKYAEDVKQRYPDRVYRVLYLRHAGTKMINKWHEFLKQSPDHYHTLNQVMRFKSEKVKKTDYVTKKLPYDLETGETPAWDRILSVLYDPSEQHKIMWVGGCFLSGDSRFKQKMAAFYGAGGTGKTTITNEYKKLSEGFCETYSSKSMGSGYAFAISAFAKAPLVAIDSEGDLSKLEDNTALNSIVSHDEVIVNEKNKSLYSNSFKCFLILASNKPVKITDSRSGLIRRIIDISPTGKTIPGKEYDALIEQLEFEKGKIAKKMLDVYLADPRYYDHYVPYSMISATNPFYNFVADNYIVLSAEEGISATSAYSEYKQWCDATNSFKMTKTAFDEELKSYFDKFEVRHRKADGTYPRNWYSGFKKDKIEGLEPDEPKRNEPSAQPLHILALESEKSALDELLKDCPAQYASTKETPLKPWISVSTKLSQINTRRLHYVLGPKNLIFIDFDLQDKDGNKLLEKNLEEASKWPATYAELSKSGKGIHLYYIYDGDPEELAYVYKENIEIKVQTGKSSIRRKLTKCNSLPVAHISSGLPLKGEKPVVKSDVTRNAESLQRFIVNCLKKKYPPNSTKSSIDFIYTKLEEAYARGIPYDFTNMRQSISNFAENSTHNKEYCLRIVNKMKFKSAVEASPVAADNPTIVIFDVEVFPNLFVICWKPVGPASDVVTWKNPTPDQVKKLLKYNIVGFNNLRYDNHILWAAAYYEYSPMQLYLLSQRIIGGDRDAYIRESKGLSYTDIYDFSAVKQSLKKFEIDLNMDHKELGYRWDQPVPEDKWDEVAAYCVNDVICTEAVWYARQGDFAARKILVAIANHGQEEAA